MTLLAAELFLFIFLYFCSKPCVSNVYIGTTGAQGNYSNFVKTKRELDTKAGRDRSRQDREVAHLQVY